MTRAPRLHTKGPKVKRDRAKCVEKYRHMADFFWWKKSVSDDQLAGMSPQTVYNLSEDFFNALTRKQKQKYAESIGAVPRSNPTSFRWFLFDLLRFSQRPRIWLYLSAPFRYPRFLDRVKQRESLRQAAGSAT